MIKIIFSGSDSGFLGIEASIRKKKRTLIFSTCVTDFKSHAEGI